MALFDALPFLERSSQFTAGTLGFWQRAYARELSEQEFPKSWKALLEESVREADRLRFMFALESAYAFLARAMLAKAMQDAGFPGMDALAVFKRAAENRQAQGRLQPPDYLDIATEVFGHAGRQAYFRRFLLQTSLTGGKILPGFLILSISPNRLQRPC